MDMQIPHMLKTCTLGVGFLIRDSIFCGLENTIAGLPILS